MKVYLDYAATTPLRKEVLEAMKPYLKDKFGNASSLHQWGQEARKAVEKARERVAQVLNCQPLEIIFTGTTTLSDNLAIQGVVRALQDEGKHLITSSIEHHGVLNTFEFLEKQGFRVDFLSVDKTGLLDLEELKRLLNKETILVSVMLANNEIGTIEPIKEISSVIRYQLSATRHPPLFHTDAAACAEYLDLNVSKLGTDLLSLGAHKFGGPKGVGILYYKKGTPIEPLTFGGHHERGLSPGTENVAGIVGTSVALELAQKEREKLSKKVTRLRDYLIKGVLKIKGVVLTGHPEKRLPDIASFCFKGVEGEALLLSLDDKGIGVSSGSACTSGTLEPSHVLLACGISPALAHGSLRFSLGRGTTKEDIDYVLKVLPGIVRRLRKIAGN